MPSLLAGDGDAPAASPRSPLFSSVDARTTAADVVSGAAVAARREEEKGVVTGGRRTSVTSR
jgi:hypothetical protein